MRPNNLPSKLTVSAALFALALFVSFAAPSPASANDGDHEVRFRTALHGPAINGIRPEGRAEFEREDRNDRNDNDNDGHQKRFSTEVDKVNLGDNTILEVDVDGVKVGKHPHRGRQRRPRSTRQARAQSASRQQSLGDHERTSNSHRNVVGKT